MRRRSLLAAGAASLVPLVAGAQAPVVIKMGWAITPAQLPPIIFANPAS